MVKAGSRWRTVDGKVVDVQEVIDAHVHYTINCRGYSCFTEAFVQRFFPVAKRRFGQILVTQKG